MRIDRPRTLLAAVAALLSAVGCAAALSDDGMSSFELAARVFAGEAAIAALFALWPTRGPWSFRRRALAGAVAGALPRSRRSNRIFSSLSMPEVLRPLMVSVSPE